MILSKIVDLAPGSIYYDAWPAPVEFNLNAAGDENLF